MTTRAAPRVAPKSPTARPTRSPSTCSSMVCCCVMVNSFMLGPPGGGRSFEDSLAGVAATLRRRCNRVARCRRQAGAPSETRSRVMDVDIPRVAGSLDELVAGATDRELLRPADARSGAIVRAAADRRPRVLPQGAVGRGGLDHAGHRQHHPLGADRSGRPGCTTRHRPRSTTRWWRWRWTGPDRRRGWRC